MAKIVLSDIILEQLRAIEPDATEFVGTPPRIESSNGKIYFVKIGDPSEKEQYAGEAESLKAMQIAAAGLAPRLLSFDVFPSGQPFFISEFKDSDALTREAAEILGKRLATELHMDKGLKGFGFEIPTYCGATRLSNGWFKTWEECYSAMLNDLLQQLRIKGGYQALCNTGEKIKETVIPKLLGSLVIQPVLLHGDLWSGNVGVDRATGQPFIFDPASYYGHNEADLGIARMFGGFPESFYEAYHRYHPKTQPVDQYPLRAELYELFHHLNHTLLFGGHYAMSANEKMEKLLNSLT